MYTYSDGSKHLVPSVKSAPAPLDATTLLETRMGVYATTPLGIAAPAQQIMREAEKLKILDFAQPILDEIYLTSRELSRLSRFADNIGEDLRLRKQSDWKERSSFIVHAQTNKLLARFHSDTKLCADRLDGQYRDFMLGMNEFIGDMTPEFKAAYTHFVHACEPHLNAIGTTLQTLDQQLSSLNQGKTR